MKKVHRGIMLPLRKLPSLAIRKHSHHRLPLCLLQPHRVVHHPELDAAWLPFEDLADGQLLDAFEGVLGLAPLLGADLEGGRGGREGREKGKNT